MPQPAPAFLKKAQAQVAAVADSELPHLRDAALVVSGRSQLAPALSRVLDTLLGAKPMELDVLYQQLAGRVNGERYNGFKPPHAS